MSLNLHAMKIATLRTLRNTFGEDFVMDKYRDRALHRYRCNKVVFVHIPKAAGTSVCSALYGSRVGHFTLMELSASRHYHRVSALPSFTISRDPVTRIHSSYRYARNGGGTAGAITPHPAYNSSAFRSFGAFLDEWLVHQELDTLDRVFWPQSRFLPAPDAQLDFIGKLEALDQTQRWLKEHCALDLTIAHRNRGQAGGPACESKTSAIGPTERALIRELYCADYEALDYT